MKKEVNGIYYWLEEGRPGMPTLVFLHGLSSNHTTWLAMITAAKAMGYSTIALDLRGHGLSDKTRERKRYKIPVMSEDLEGILDSERVESAIIIGYSYGAYVGMEYAAAHPARAKALVLVSANYVSPFRYHWFSFLSPLAHFAVDAFGWMLVWQKRKSYYYYDPTRSVGYWHSTWSGYATMPLSINFWMLSEVFALDYRQKLGKISSPTLIVRGQSDNFVTPAEARDMASMIPGAELVTLETGHFVASHFQEVMSKVVFDFVEKLK